MKAKRKGQEKKEKLDGWRADDKSETYRKRVSDQMTALVLA